MTHQVKTQRGRKLGNPNPKKKFQKGNQAAKGQFIAPKVYEGRRLTRVLYEEILHKYLHMSKRDLERIVSDPGDTPAIELLVISILAKALTGGDDKRGEFLIARLVGKVPDKIEITDRTEEVNIQAMAQKLLEIAKEPN